MAVKPITNKQLVNKESVNRAEHVSVKGSDSWRGSNSRKSYSPGIDFTKNYSVTLKNIDTSIINYIKNVMKLKVTTAGEQKNVPVMYANQERWVNVSKNNYLKDKSGAIILPLIMLRRTTVEQNSELDVGMEHDNNRKYAQVIRNSSWSKNNRYDRFAVQTGKKPVYENILTGVPDYVIINYDFIVWTNFMEQMNVILETFVEQDNQYWGDSEDYKFLCNVESIADSTEMSVDSERFIKSTFTLATNAYLLPEYISDVVSNKISQVQRKLTPGKVIFGYEGDATNKQIKG